MKLIHRRIIYLSFIAFFIIITPIVIIYTTGYRYNFKRGRLEKTGIIYLESTPRSAKIYVNGVYLDDTPARFTQLLPDKYSVEVRKEGFHSWYKTIEVSSNLTTFEKNIILFRQSLPELAVAGKIGFLAASPARDKIVYSISADNVEEIRLINIDNDTDFLIKKITLGEHEEISFINWSPNQNKALIKISADEINEYLIVNLETMAITELKKISDRNFDQIAWDAGDTNFLYALSQSALYRIDLTSRQVKLILNDSISAFQVQGPVIYYISREQDEFFLNRETLVNLELTNPEKIKLPPSENYLLLGGSPSYIVLSGSSSSEIFIIDDAVFSDFNKENFNVSDYVIFSEKAKTIKWSSDYRQILYFTDFDIYTFDFLSRQKYLVTRYAENIIDAIWYPENHYLIYQAGPAVHATETCCADEKNDILLTNNAENKRLIVNDSGKYLYFSAKIGSQEGLYKLQLQ